MFVGASASPGPGSVASVVGAGKYLVLILQSRTSLVLARKQAYSKGIKYCSGYKVLFLSSSRVTVYIEGSDCTVGSLRALGRVPGKFHSSLRAGLFPCRSACCSHREN